MPATKMKIAPEVLKDIMDRHGFTSDQQLASMLGVNVRMIERVREGQPPSNIFIAGMFFNLREGFDIYEPMHVAPTSR